MTRARSNAIRLGDSVFQSGNTVSAGDEMMPAPKKRNPVARSHQTELDRVPVEARQICERPKFTAPCGHPCRKPA